jgi:hypothetical protein
MVCMLWIRAGSARGVTSVHCQLGGGGGDERWLHEDAIGGMAG